MKKYYVNNLGTLSFIGKFPGMRKEQDFIVYPITSNSDHKIRCQSENRWMEINAQTGSAEITTAQSGHHNNWLLTIQRMRGKHKTFTLDAETLSTFKERIAETSGKLVGGSIMKTDNSGAASI